MFLTTLCVLSACTVAALMFALGYRARCKAVQALWQQTTNPGTLLWAERSRLVTGVLTFVLAGAGWLATVLFCQNGGGTGGYWWAWGLGFAVQNFSALYATAWHAEHRRVKRLAGR